MKTRTTLLPTGQEVQSNSKANAQLLWSEIFEEDLYSQFDIELSDGACVFDVGANIGFFVMYLNKRLNRGRVLAFEPIPETFRLLQKNTSTHNQLELELFDCGLSNEEGRAEFTYYPRLDVASTRYPDKSREFRRNSRQFALEEMRSRSRLFHHCLRFTPRWFWFPMTEAVRRYYQSGRTVECRLSTVSEIVDERKITKIDLLKVDVEGSEEDVLRGIRDEHWPMIDQLIVEVHKGVASADSISDLLKKRGFEVKSMQPNLEVAHLFLLFAKRAAGAR